MIAGVEEKCLKIDLKDEVVVDVRSEVEERKRDRENILWTSQLNTLLPHPQLFGIPYR